MRTRFFTALTAVSFSALSLVSCTTNDDEVVLFVDQGVVLTDFASIADYLDNATVRDILASMPRNRGSSPPDVSGEYAADGELISNTIPGSFVGDAFTYDFCFGVPVGSGIVARIIDSTVEDGGASCFIEGSGDSFTVYTGFKSVDTSPDGAGCEVHQVVVISGDLEPDGSLSNLSIGQGVVGLLGDCGNLILGDFQVAEAVGDRVADTCNPPPEACNQIELVVDNFLVNPVVVSLDYPNHVGPQPFVIFPNSEEDPIAKMVPPGFTLSVTTLQPSSLGPSDDAEQALGEVIGATFAADTSAAGDSVTYTVTNEIGDSVYWSPSPINKLTETIYAVVNVGKDYGVRPVPVDTGIGCVCPLDPSSSVIHDLGYYSYSVPGFITPAETNIRFYAFADDTELATADGPFTLEDSTGVVILDVE